MGIQQQVHASTTNNLHNTQQLTTHSPEQYLVPRPPSRDVAVDGGQLERRERREEEHDGSVQEEGELRRVVVDLRELLLPFRRKRVLKRGWHEGLHVLVALLLDIEWKCQAR